MIEAQRQVATGVMDELVDFERPLTYFFQTGRPMNESISDNNVFYFFILHLEKYCDLC